MAKKSLEEIIAETAVATANEVVNAQRKQRNTNLYRAAERLLRSYPKLKRLAENPEEYGFTMAGKSKDISVAPPPGSIAKDKADILEDYTVARHTSFQRTMARFCELQAIVNLYTDSEDFIVIRMYYFNEDPHGNPRPDAQKYTFEEIAEDLSAVGITRSERTLRSWRTRIVQEITVLLWGSDGAICLESRDTGKQERINEQ